MNFADKVVLVTGAASGMGFATAIRFSQLGAELAIVDCNAESLKKVAKKCKKPPLQVKANLTNEDDVERVASEVLCKYKKLDVLVNGAGVMEMGTIENTNLAQFDRIMNTNIRAMYQLTMLTVPELIKTKGNIVNISSVCGLRSFPDILAYNISKSAVDQFTRCVALELGLKGVRCNAVNPGVILTNLHRSAGMDKEQYVEFLKRAKFSHALGRAGNVNEVSGVICFLASELASFITGVTLSVDGGRHAMCPR